MSLDSAIIITLAQPVVNETFRILLKFRILPFYELVKNAKDKGELRKALEELQNKGLIEKQASGFEDLDKYFLTREGLEAEKLIAK